jgi:hypothetical protein
MGATIAAAFGSLVVGLSGAGCAWVTDAGANGYMPRDAGAEPLVCTSSAECDTGTVCCVTSMSSPLATSCVRSCPELPVTTGVQLCATAAECANGTCVEQECFGTLVAACGLVSQCALLTSDAAGAIDTSVPLPVLDATTNAD